jgi:hypothetical protein
VSIEPGPEMRRARSLARHMAEQEALTAMYEVLEHQWCVLRALQLGRESLWESTDEEMERLHAIETRVGRLILAQCDRIMRASGLDKDGRDDLPF